MLFVCCFSFNHKTGTLLPPMPIISFHSINSPSVRMLNFFGRYWILGSNGTHFVIRKLCTMVKKFRLLIHSIFIKNQYNIL